MKDYENVVKALTFCADEDIDRCDECPYGGRCQTVKKDAVELLEELKAQLDTPVPGDSAGMPNYKEINRKLEDKLCEAEIAHERAQRELCEAQKELAYLRAVKATAEAFLGVKIDGQM